MLKKYRLGLCTERELTIINQWYNSFDDKEKEMIDDEEFIKIRQQMYRNILKEIEEIEPASKSKQYKGATLRMKPAFYWSGIAAALLIGVFYSVHVFLSQADTNTGESVSNSVEVENVPVEKEKLPSVIYLSDGSIVRLKTNSTLSYPTVFSGDTREVSLTGEAFFEIAKNKEKPFIIHAGNLTTKVLGTSFHIKAYENEESSEVAVVTGQVAVKLNDKSSSKDNEVVLTKNQKAIYSKNSHSLIQTEELLVQNDNTDNKANLVFNETPFGEIIKILNKYYDVNIFFEDEGMKNCLITAELTDEPLEVSLKILTRAIGATYEIENEKIRLLGKGCEY